VSNKVILADYDPVWSGIFETEARKIKDLLGPNVQELHHIGSTAVPGLIAKPIIDIMPVVRSLREVDMRRQLIEETGYLYKGEYGIPGRRYIVRNEISGVSLKVHIHIFELNCFEIPKHLNFRDYLRANPAQAKKYGELKVRLKHEFENDKNAYQKGKADFIEGFNEYQVAFTSRLSE
jgi:GrpB-like predicted nucleotidyltransferase (UPF0157 family)